WSARAPALWSIQSPGLLALTHSMLNPGDELDIGKTFKFHQESNTTLALLGVGVALVVARRFHDGEAPILAPVATALAERADLPVTGAPRAVDSSPGAAPVSEFGRSAAALAEERRLAAEAGTEAEYASYLGVRLQPGQTFAGYIADLDTRIAGDDTAAMVEMAKILNSCWYARSRAEDAVAFKREADDDYEQTLLIDRVCDSALVLADEEQVRNRRAELVSEAARRGDASAVLAQFQNSPYWVGLDPQSQRSRAWVSEASGRLEALASTGNLEANSQLGMLYSAGSLMVQDFVKAAPYFRSVLDNAHMNSREALARMLMPGQDKGRYQERYFQTLQAERMLDVICGKISPGSAAPGVCK
ncbi:MAG: hypothetical protein Q8J93_05320, partial [Xanthomonadales bacterium]|nr:hypothetical protein [Xanthomonadales bacterium]